MSRQDRDGSESPAGPVSARCHCHDDTSRAPTAPCAPWPLQPPRDTGTEQPAVPGRGRAGQDRAVAGLALLNPAAPQRGRPRPSAASGRLHRRVPPARTPGGARSTEACGPRQEPAPLRVPSTHLRAPAVPALPALLRPVTSVQRTRARSGLPVPLQGRRHRRMFTKPC